ncbi:dienelactone hydrolase family protein [Kocuria palustris]|nr:dienelactone hydrolase family protein [Kocuria palustris]
MASACGPCCLETNFHEGTPKGSHSQIGGLDTYSVGSGKKIVVILTDIYGHKYNNTLLIADEISKAGYQVLIPDILKGDPVPAEHGDLGPWLQNHTQEITTPIVNGFLKKIREELQPTFVGGIGYCFGAKYVVLNLAKDGLLDAGAGAHPSFVTIDDVKAITKPLLFSCAEVDPIFPADARFEAEKALAEIGARYQVDLFLGVSHGFACRGDMKDPVVKYAAEKALSDQICWFHQFAK